MEEADLTVSWHCQASYKYWMHLWATQHTGDQVVQHRLSAPACWQCNLTAVIYNSLAYFGAASASCSISPPPLHQLLLRADLHLPCVLHLGRQQKQLSMIIEPRWRSQVYKSHSAIMEKLRLHLCWASNVATPAHSITHGDLKQLWSCHLFILNQQATKTFS